MKRAPAPRMIWVAALFLFAGLSSAQTPSPSLRAAGVCWLRGDPARLAARKSPLDSVTASLEGVEIKVCYGRPAARGRAIMGGLVPYGQPWRLGADEATTIEVSRPVRFGDLRLLAGTYSLYAIPGPDHWEIVVNRSAQRWGVPIGAPVRASDLGSTTVPTQRTEQAAEQLTLRLEPRAGAGLVLVVEWEHTRIQVPIKQP